MKTDISPDIQGIPAGLAESSTGVVDVQDTSKSPEPTDAVGEASSNTTCSRTEIAEATLGEVQWIGDTEGYLTCPGESIHNSPSGPRDCKLYLEPVPTITCFHTSCAEVVKAKNLELRRALADPNEAAQVGERRRRTPEQIAQTVEMQRKEGVRRRASCCKEQILRTFYWPVAEIEKSSPTPVESQVWLQWRQHLGLFQPEDVIWVGGLYDSGREAYAANFRLRDEWLAGNGVPGPYVCPSVFKTGEHSRGNDKVLLRRFLVVESDILTKDEVGAIFWWLKERVRMRLRAIVDTGGKSLHGWFDCPDEGMMADLRLTLPQWDCDPKLFTPSQPVRLAGAWSPEKNAWQRLLYVDTNGGAQ